MTVRCEWCGREPSPESALMASFRRTTDSARFRALSRELLESRREADEVRSELREARRRGSATTMFAVVLGAMGGLAVLAVAL